MQLLLIALHVLHLLVTSNIGVVSILVKNAHFLSVAYLKLDH